MTARMYFICKKLRSGWLQHNVLPCIFYQCVHCTVKDQFIQILPSLKDTLSYQLRAKVQLEYNASPFLTSLELKHFVIGY